MEGNKVHYGLCENDELRTSLMLALVFSILSIVGTVSPAQEIDIIREFNLYVNAKRQTSDSSWEFLKMENEQIKTPQKISLDTLKNCVKLLIYV